MDIREMVRRFRAGESQRQVAKTMGLARKTVGRYHKWAEEQGLLEGNLPPLEALQALVEATLPESPPPQNVSTVEPYRELVKQLRAEQVEIAAIHQRLRERGFTGDYMAVYRFVRKLEPRTPEATVRVETRPGEEAQVDFGYVNMMIDPETGARRKTWAFVMLLSWSRHQYVEFVFDQKVETWLLCHRHAFEFFGGVPERVVIDNLKAGIAKASWEQPEAQHAYAELAEHYGFLISPCRPRTPQHKGKVERGVRYIQRNFCGGRGLLVITEANRDVREWCAIVAGLRLHGTTRERPLHRFEREQAVLQPLPSAPYDLSLWKRVQVHRDCYVVFDNAYYSVPFELVGQTVWVRGGTQTVRIYTQTYQLVATHDRAPRPGERQTHLAHLPPHKIAGLMLTRESCRAQADEIGPYTRRVVDRLLDHRPEDRLRTAGRLLGLGQRFGRERLEAACARAWQFEDPSYATIKRILQEGLDQELLPETHAPAPAQTFVRTAKELVGHLLGGGTWN